MYNSNCWSCPSIKTGVIHCRSSGDTNTTQYLLSVSVRAASNDEASMAAGSNDNMVHCAVVLLLLYSDSSSQ